MFYPGLAYGLVSWHVCKVHNVVLQMLEIGKCVWCWLPSDFSVLDARDGLSLLLGDTRCTL
jgi:hypothetical protein